MTSNRHIQDDFGNSVPMFDAYGNLSVQVIMLYAEDKLTEADRKAVDDFASTDEMSRDALDGYATLPQTSKTRLILGNLNSEIQKATGSAALPIQMDSKAPFNYRKLAAAIALMVVIGGGTFWVSRFFSGNDMAENITLVNDNDSTESVTEAEASVANSPSVETTETLSSKREKTDLKTSLDDAENEDKKRSQKAESTLVKQPEKLSVPTGSTGADNKRPESVKTTNTDLKDAGRSEDVGAKKKSTSADIDLAQAKQDQTKTTTANQSEGQKIAEKKAKENLAKEAESRATAGRMREESAKAEAKEYESAYEPSATTAASGQISTGSELSAKFQGGDADLYKFIEKKKTYSEALKAQNITGTIAVWFDIETDGRVTNARIKTGENGILTEDALRVVRSMPKWKPAQNEAGEPIKSSRTVVIKYGQE